MTKYDNGWGMWFHCMIVTKEKIMRRRKKGHGPPSFAFIDLFLTTFNFLHCKTKERSGPYLPNVPLSMYDKHDRRETTISGINHGKARPDTPCNWLPIWARLIRENRWTSTSHWDLLPGSLTVLIVCFMYLLCLNIMHVVFCEWFQPFDVLSGGVSALMAESMASLGAYVSSGFKRVAGVQLATNHLRAVLLADVVEAEARPIQAGKTIQVYIYIYTHIYTI